MNAPVHLFPPERFPITVRAFRSDNGALVWEHTVTLEMARETVPVNVPALKEKYGVPVYIEIYYSDGTAANHAGRGFRR